MALCLIGYVNQMIKPQSITESTCHDCPCTPCDRNKQKCAFTIGRSCFQCCLEDEDFPCMSKETTRKMDKVC